MSEQGIQNIFGQMLVYPADGNRKQQAKSGKYRLDFLNGLVTDPDGETESMSKSLSQLGTNFIRSCFITVSTVEATIKVGNNVLPTGHQLTYVVNGLAFEIIEITFPSDRTPKDDFSFSVIGSDAPVFPIESDTLVGLHNPTSKTGTTTASYVTVLDFVFRGYSSSEIIIENTHATNIMIADVQVSQDGTNWVSAQNYPLDVSNLDFNIFQNTINHRYIRVRLKTKTDPNHATYRIQLNLER